MVFEHYPHALRKNTRQSFLPTLVLFLYLLKLKKDSAIAPRCNCTIYNTYKKDINNKFTKKITK